MVKAWMDLTGRTVIVTGGNSGVGSHIVENLKANKANVVVCDLHENSEYNNNITFIQCDVTKKESVKAMVAKTIELFGKVDALVNNAGVNRPRLLVDYYKKNKLYEFSEEDFEFIVNVNQKGPFLCTQAVARNMIENQSGVIINISSEAGSEGSAGQSVYSATKGAINAFTRSWAKELGKFNIRVVGVAPGINQRTEMNNDQNYKALAYTRGLDADKIDNDYTKIIPLGRVGNLDEIGDLVSYLVSEHSSYITGTTINISGGKSR
jgi:sorbitol-6-phosphate 2-dehydrogenase